MLELTKKTRLLVRVSGVCHVRQPLHGSAFVVCRKVRVQAQGTGICYASALCFAVRLILSGAKTTPQDSNCRYEKCDGKGSEPRPVNPSSALTVPKSLSTSCHNLPRTCSRTCQNFNGGVEIDTRTRLTERIVRRSVISSKQQWMGVEIRRHNRRVRSVADL